MLLKLIIIMPLITSGVFFIHSLIRYRAIRKREVEQQYINKDKYI